MFVFGCAITDPEIYARCAERGIRRAAEPDSEVIALRSAGSIFRNYNLLCDQAAERENLEALFLVHQDAEIVDPDLCAKLRAALEDPEVAIVGCAGSIGARSIAWWEGSVTWASFAHRYEELGGGEIPAATWDPDALPPYARTGEVDTIDGFAMALSPWAVHELRFDESLGALHGYDFDICMQARAMGRKVVTADYRAVHHHSLDFVRPAEDWIEAHIRVAEKWEDRLSPTSPDGDSPASRADPAGDRTAEWRRRALRAEADAAARQMRLNSVTHKRDAEARVRRAEAEALGAQVDALRGQLGGVKRSASWRLTEPLRALKRLARRAARR